MKKSQKTALCGVFTALAVVIMLTSYFPYVTYATPALGGIVFAAITIETDRKWAFGSYIACSVLVMLMCEKEAATLFVGFFGYYCILKGVIEQYFRGILEHILKHLVFSVSMIIGYAVIVFVFGIPFDESGQFGYWFYLAMLVAGNIVFAIYDAGLTRVIGAYIYKFHPKISRIFK